MVSLVGVVTLVTSAITGAVISVVVVVLSVVVVSLSVVVVSLSEVVEVVEEPPSLLLLHEMTVRLKRMIEKRMMSIRLTRFPISGLGKPKLYQNLGDFTRKWEGCGKCVFYSSSIIPLHPFPFVVLFFLSVFCLLLATFQ